MTRREGERLLSSPQADSSSPGGCREVNPAGSPRRSGWTLIHSDSQILHFKPSLVSCSEISVSCLFGIFQKLYKNPALRCHQPRTPNPTQITLEAKESSAPNLADHELCDLKQNISFPSSSLTWRSGSWGPFPFIPHQISGETLGGLITEKMQQEKRRVKTLCSKKWSIASKKF